MDGLGWDSLEVVTDSLPLWNSDLTNDIGDSFLMSNSNSSMYGCQMDLPDDILNPIRELQKAQPSCLNPDSNILQCQAVRSVASTSHLKSVNLGDVLTQELCSSPLINEARGLSTSNVSISDMEMAVQSQVINGSLDCLLSATNSNTDTSVEDDGISMIFSDCKNLWNLAFSSSAVSSGDSENNGSNTTRINDDTVSQSYSDPYINDKESQAKPGYSKGCNDQNDEFKAGLNCRGYFNLLQTDISAVEGGFRLTPDNLRPKAKKSRSEKRHCSSNINFQQPSSSASSSSIEGPDHPGTIDAQMKEIIYRAAVFRPVNLGLEVVEKPKRKNVRISSDPQTMAARQRRERISERIRVLQRLVPGGSNMDTASMLDEAANYLKFLRSQVKALKNSGHKLNPIGCPPTNLDFSSLSFNHSLPVQTHNFRPLNSNHIHR